MGVACFNSGMQSGIKTNTSQKAWLGGGILKGWMETEDLETNNLKEYQKELSAKTTGISY